MSLVAPGLVVVGVCSAGTSRSVEKIRDVFPTSPRTGVHSPGTLTSQGKNRVPREKVQGVETESAQQWYTQTPRGRIGPGLGWQPPVYVVLDI